MTEEMLLEYLRKLGLKNYEAKGYLALMERKSLTATQISIVSGVPRTKVYDVTESLMKKGLCSLIPGKINKYRGTEFDAAVDRLLEENQKIFIERKEQIRDAAVNLREQLVKLHHDLSKDVDPFDYIEIIKDPNLIQKRFMQLVEGAREEVLVFSKGSYSDHREKIEEQIDQEKEVLKDGIIGKCIYEIPSGDYNKKRFFEVIEQSVKAGEEARVIDELPMKMVIIDTRIVLLALEDPISRRPSFTTQVIEHRSLAKGLKILFETLWVQAEDYHVLNI
ncbi:MAG: TrmB family transcriptional regulator [Candidatus Aegiribacteria sp.]|nr:TrmB family transcriptional regulator [Candidatus Aegiribacteria sp.]